MQIIKFLVIFSILIFTKAAQADVVYSKGMGVANFSGHSFFGSPQLEPGDKDLAIKKAELNAIDTYYAELGASQTQNYDAIRSKVKANLSDYILDYTILNESDDSKAGTCTITLRVSINTATLSNLVKADSATVTSSSANKSYIMFVFVSRSINSIQSYDPRVYQHQEINGVQSASSELAVKGSEGQSISKNQIDTSTDKSVNANETAQFSQTEVTGGSVINKASKTQWQIYPSQNIDSAISGVLTQAGYNPVDEAFVEPYTNGVMKISEIDADYATGNDLSPQTLNHIVMGARTAKIAYVALGTLDIGTTQTDPVTGDKRVAVTVNARVLDITGLFPKTIALVGPVQYFGLGPTEMTAQTSALTNAGVSAAKDLASQMQNAGFH